MHVVFTKRWTSRTIWPLFRCCGRRICGTPVTLCSWLYEAGRAGCLGHPPFCVSADRFNLKANYGTILCFSVGAADVTMLPGFVCLRRSGCNIGASFGMCSGPFFVLATCIVVVLLLLFCRVAQRLAFHRSRIWCPAVGGISEEVEDKVWHDCGFSHRRPACRTMRVCSWVPGFLGQALSS